MASLDEKLIEQLIRENKELKQKLKKEVELYEKANMEMVKLNVETERFSQKLFAAKESMDVFFSETIQLLEKIIEIRSPGYILHANRVRLGGEFLAKKLKLHEDRIKNISIAARIHEIGKIGIRRSILNKPKDMINSDDIAIISKHPMIARSLFEDLSMYEEIAEIIIHMRDNYDGSGSSPLEGEKIPLGSRILAIAETFDSYFMDRKNETITDIYNKLQRKANKAFDPLLVEYYEAFCYQQYENQQSDNFLYLDLQQIVPGLKLARNLRSLSNILLVPKDTELTEELIAKIKKYAQKELVDTIVVYKNLKD